MNNYLEGVRKRSQTLLIVEGNHEKNELFRLLFRCFPEMKISMEDIWIYGTNIYMLYDDIVKEYGEEWEEDDIDLPFVISKKQGMAPLRYKDDFTNIILVFDYERHDTNFAEEKIIRMQKCFMDSTDMGKLYINYPMIESYQHLRSLPDEEYADRKISVSLQPGKRYKAIVRKESVIHKIIEFPNRLNDLLEKHFYISDTISREKCCEKILAIRTGENLPGQIQKILAGVINDEFADTANYQLADMIEKVNYADSLQTYWEYMRNVFQQIVWHNIYKAGALQYHDASIEWEKYREYFDGIDVKEILKIQNAASKNSETGIIWVLCTCVFLIPEYNLSLVIEEK